MSSRRESVKAGDSDDLFTTSATSVLVAQRLPLSCVGLRHQEDRVTIQMRFRSTCIPRWRSRALARTVCGGLVLVLAAMCTPAAAQSGSGVAAIEGTVTDPDN